MAFFPRLGSSPEAPSLSGHLYYPLLPSVIHVVRGVVLEERRGLDKLHGPLFS